VGLNLASAKILDGNGIKAMPGLIPAPHSVSFESAGDQMGDLLLIP